jgi:hypothetical protein
LNLNGSFPFDQVFELLVKSQRLQAFSFKSGRSLLSGGWKGRSDYSFLSLTRAPEMPDYEYVKSLSEKFDIRFGA